MDKTFLNLNWGDSEEEIVEFLIKSLDKNDDIVIICDYDTMRQIVFTYDDSEFSNIYKVEMSTEINEYSIYKYRYETFIVEPVKYLGDWLEIEADKILIDVSLGNKDLLDVCDSKDIEVFGYGAYEDMCKYCETDDCFGCENNEDEWDCDCLKEE